MEFGNMLNALQRSFDTQDSTKSTVLVAVGAGALVCTGFYLLSKSKKGSGTLGLSGGNIEDSGVKDAFAAFSEAYNIESGAGIKDHEKAAEVTDTYYNLATDFYEWGWGESFHFSPPLPGKNLKQSEISHQARIVGLLGLKPGMTCLDAGCGVGGPMRTISCMSGAQVLGVTINEYQVERANYHIGKAGIKLCKAVQGSFLELKNEPNTFDAAYAIEATCHAPTLESVYSQIYRVLKPGARFVSYEWLTTDKFVESDPKHVETIHSICYGNGLPNMRSIPDTLAAAKAVGFEILDARDLAIDVGAGEWYDRLVATRGTASYINKFLVNALSFLHLLPKGVKEVHDMLFDHAAGGLIDGGKSGIFTPMYLVVLQKPAA
ncbi:hypothetical protein BSKO_07738 [Bryopsis sp. KO-2023]|nr:hypothetical protein BSKO_07738 [Bryopsis sp. KO-2023]